MKKNFKVIGILSIVVFSIVIFLKGYENDKQEESGIIYTSIYPIEFITSRLIGEEIHVKSVLPLGSNPHYYTPSQKDMVEILKGSMFIYLGLGLEPKMKEINKMLEENRVKTLEIGKALDLLIEDGDHQEKEHQEHSSNLHIWIDPVEMINMSYIINNNLKLEFPHLRKSLEEKLEILVKDLEILDKEYTSVLKNTKRREFIVSHNAFEHLNKYGIESIAVKDEANSKDPTIKEIEKIIKKGLEVGIEEVVYEQNGPCLPLDIIKKELNSDKVIMSNLSVRTATEFAQDKDYLDIMRSNLEILEKILN